MALGLFLGVFLLDVNFFSALMWPGIDGGKGLLGAMGTHLATVVLSGLFAALAMATVQGVLVAVLPATAFRRVSVWTQTILMGVLVMLLFVSPMLASNLEELVRRHSLWVYSFPGYWFAGLYEQLRPAVGNSTHLINNPGDRAAVVFLLHLGSVAAWTLSGVAGSSC